MVNFRTFCLFGERCVSEPSWMKWNHAQCPKAQQQQTRRSWVKTPSAYLQTTNAWRAAGETNTTCVFDPESGSQPSLILCAVHKSFTVRSSQSGRERQLSTHERLHNSHMDRAPWGTECCSSPTGLSSPGPPGVCTRPLTHPGQGDGNTPSRASGAVFRVHTRSQVGALLASGGARRLLPPGVRVYWFPFSWGSVSTHTHTHTVSICNSIAPHGRARPRAVTQMALGDLQMTHLPNSVPPPAGTGPNHILHTDLSVRWGVTGK